MADILVKHYQAATLDMVKEKAPPRVVAMAQDVASLVLREEDGEENPVVRIFPSTVGQGMGRRYTQTAHGFSLKQPVRWAAGSWVLAQATADPSTLATHMVVSVPDVDTFEVAGFGAWNLGGTPQGPFYLSTVAGELVSAAPTSALVQLVATSDGTSFHLCLGSSTQKSTDQIVEELNDRSDLEAIPKGLAGGDLLGQYPNPVVQKLTGLSVTWQSMEPKWAETGLPFLPSQWVLAAAWKPLSSRAMLVDNNGNVYFSETDGSTWRSAGYTVCSGNVRDIAYGKISGTTYGWCVIGDDVLEWIPDLPENFVAGVPLSTAWSEAALFGSWTDICYCEALGTWFFQRQGAGLVYCYTLTTSLDTYTVTPQGATANTGGVFYESSTGRVVYFERGTGRVWWAEAGFTAAAGWTEVLLGGIPVLKAITPAMSDSNGYGAGVSTTTLAAFVGGQGVVSTTSIADPTKYTQSVGAGALPSLWDVSSNGNDLIGSTVYSIDPVLYKIYVTLGEIPSEQRIIGKKGFLSKGPLILEGMEDASFLGTDSWGATVKKTLAQVGGMAAVDVSLNGANIGSGKRLNFISGANVTLSIVDQGDTVDVSVASTGGGGGGTTYTAKTQYTGPLAAFADTVTLESGGGELAQFVGQGSIFAAVGDSVVTTASKLRMLFSNPVLTGWHIFAIYKVNADNTISLVAQTDRIQVTVGGSQYLTAQVIASQLVGGIQDGELYAMMDWRYTNGDQCAGVPGKTFNNAPHNNFKTAAMWDLQATGYLLPTTLTLAQIQAVSNSFYMRLLA